MRLHAFLITALVPVGGQSLPNLLPGLDPPGRFQSQSGRGAGDRNLPLLVGVEPRFPIHPARNLATIVADVSLFRRVTIKDARIGAFGVHVMATIWTQYTFKWIVSNMIFRLRKLLCV